MLHTRGTNLSDEVLSQLYEHCNAEGQEGSLYWTQQAVSALAYRVLKEMCWMSQDTENLSAKCAEYEVKIEEEIKKVEDTGTMRKEKKPLVEEKAMAAVPKIGDKGVEFQEWWDTMVSTLNVVRVGSKRLLQVIMN